MTRWFERRGHGVIFIARLTPGTRALVFLTAGAGHRMIYAIRRERKDSLLARAAFRGIALARPRQYES